MPTGLNQEIETGDSFGVCPWLALAMETRYRLRHVPFSFNVCKVLRSPLPLEMSTDARTSSTSNKQLLWHQAFGALRPATNILGFAFLDRDVGSSMSQYTRRLTAARKRQNFRGNSPVSPGEVVKRGGAEMLD